MGQTKRDYRREPKHVRLYASVTESEAWKHLSGNAVKVLLALVARDNGTRNGAIGFSCREAGDVAGVCDRTAWRCLRELQELGFIRCTNKGGFSRKVLHSTMWRYTWQAWPGGSPSAPTRDFEKWKCEEIHGCKICSRTVANCDEPSGNAAVPDAKNATGELETPHVSVDPDFTKDAALTLHQGDHRRAPETGNRKHAPKAGYGSPDHLRARLAAHLQKSAPGEQSRLAAALQIPPGTLSKFRHGRGLPDRYVALLEAALDADSGR